MTSPPGPYSMHNPDLCASDIAMGARQHGHRIVRTT
jgi:hypothetical protein